MDALIFIFALSCIVYSVGAERNYKNNRNVRKLMAAIDRLNTALSGLNTTLARVADGANRVADELSKLRTQEPAIEAAAVNAEAINLTLASVADQIDGLVPKV